jgi:hypothetical protein
MREELTNIFARIKVYNKSQSSVKLNNALNQAVALGSEMRVNGKVCEIFACRFDIA